MAPHRNSRPNLAADSTGDHGVADAVIAKNPFKGGALMARRPTRPKNIAAMTTAIDAAEGLEEIAAGLRATAATRPLVRWSLTLSFWNPQWAEHSLPVHTRLLGISYHNTPKAGEPIGKRGEPA